MATTGIYLNFMGKTEEAFNFYKKVFKTEFDSPIMYLGQLPAQPGMPPLADEDKKKVMHVSLPILGGVRIMGTDMLESAGHQLKIGNNTTISLEFDTRADADMAYAQLAEGASECAPMSEQFWGYWGVCLDKFGIRWMFNVMNK